MFVRVILASLILPGIFAVALPGVLVYIDPWRQGGWGVGAIIMAVGLLGLLWCIGDFCAYGKGTLAPWDPPQHLVVVGLYRFTRNPMYIGVLLLVGGWSLLTGSWLLASYLIVLAVAFHLRVVFHEEPWLSKKFTGDWSVYSAGVPRWLPRVTPWHAGHTNS